jgi:hypothetical protein
VSADTSLEKQFKALRFQLLEGGKASNFYSKVQVIACPFGLEVLLR